MREDHQQALNEIEKLLPEVSRTAHQAKLAAAAERAVEVQVLERVVHLLGPYFEQLADIIVVRREEVASEANPALNQFHREDFPEQGICIYEDDHEDGTGVPNRMRLYGRRLYVLAGGRLLLVDRDGFREVKKRRGLRPDRHEVWGSKCREVTPDEAFDFIVLVEVVLDAVKEALLMTVGLAEDTVTSCGERTAKLMKLLDLVN